VREDCLKLTTYFGERDRANGRFLADALLDIYERQALQMSVLLRGTEGFGIKHRLHTQRLLTLSEDLPIVSVAVDTRERIEATLNEVTAVSGHGLVTLERARMFTGEVDRVSLPEELGDATKLTVYCGRQERTDDTPSYLAVVDLLHRRGIAGATVLLGVDGTAHGIRQRARFFARNQEVPLMVISIGDGERIASALPELSRRLSRPLMTLERVQVLKRDGERRAQLESLPPHDESGLARWQKLMVYASEHAHYKGRPLHVALVQRLRQEKAAGATALRGIWGFHGDHTPHGERFWALRREVPVLTVLVDTPQNARRWFDIVDEVTTDTGLVTSEIVPAFRATGPGLREGGLRLADAQDAA
jgi:PII-like signaling protein